MWRNKKGNTAAINKRGLSRDDESLRGPTEMEINLEKAIAGLRLAARSVHSLNYELRSCLEPRDENKSSVVSGEEHQDSGHGESLTISDEDLCRARDCSTERKVDVRLRGREEEGGAAKKRRLDNSRRESVYSSDGKGEGKFFEESRINTHAEPELCENRAESSCSTYFSCAEDGGFETAREAPSSLTTRTLGQPYSVLTDNSEVLRSIRVLFRALEDEELVLEYKKKLRWYGTVAETAVQLFVQLADSSCAVGTAQLCRIEALASLQRVYQRFLKSRTTTALRMDTLWINQFSILLTICDSESICEEFANYFINRMITPKYTEDLEDPKEIIDSLVEHDTARFGLVRLYRVLKKYPTSPEVGKANPCCPKPRKTKHGLNVRLLRKLDEYVAKNSINFPGLSYVAARNISLMKERLSS